MSAKTASGGAAKVAVPDAECATGSDQPMSATTATRPPSASNA
jgi:hypothetical protein